MLAFSPFNMKIINFILQTLFLFSLLNFAASDNFATKLKNVRNYKGPLASVFTPFKGDAEQSLNLSTIPSYAEFLSSKNVGGVLVAGTMGEGTSLTVEERKELAEAWADTVKTTKQHLMVQVGGTALKSVKELAAHAETIGADSVLVLPDLYVKPNSVEDLVDYLKLISEAAPNTPLIYYQSATFDVKIDVAKFLQTVGKKVPTFAGIKHVTGDPAALLKAWVAAGNRYKLFIGDDVSSLVGCVIGMNSMIIATSTVIPELSFRILENCHKEATFQTAIEAQDSINTIVEEIDIYGDDTVAMKAATSMVARIQLGSPRPPLKTLSPAELQSMAQTLTKLGFEV